MTETTIIKLHQYLSIVACFTNQQDTLKKLSKNL